MNYPEDLWETEFNIVFVGKPYNYLKRLKVKQQVIETRIRYLEGVINNPEYTTATKEFLFIPDLKLMLRVKKTFEKQGSLLAA